MKIELIASDQARIHRDQHNFRLLLQAFAYPGQIVSFPVRDLPQPGESAHCVVLATLADPSTVVWIDATLPEAADIARLARCPLGTIETSSFAVCRSDALLPLDRFWQGTLFDPHLSTTIIAEVASLTEGDLFRLTGPGVPQEGRIFAPCGLPNGFAAAWMENNRSFPCGVDLILTAGAQCACLPRSVKMEPANVCAR